MYIHELMLDDVKVSSNVKSTTKNGSGPELRSDCSAISIEIIVLATSVSYGATLCLSDEDGEIAFDLYVRYNSVNSESHTVNTINVSTVVDLVNCVDH